MCSNKVVQHQKMNQVLQSKKCVGHSPYKKMFLNLHNTLKLIQDLYYNFCCLVWL